MDALENFNNWKAFLGANVDRAQAMGVSDEKIADLATKVGEYLAKAVNPKNSEERVLKELWDVATEDEKHTMARMMVRLADKAH